MDNRLHFRELRACLPVLTEVKGQAGASPQVFAFGEDTHTLRLVNKFPDLRVGYVNWIPLRYACGVQFNQ